TVARSPSWLRQTVALLLLCLVGWAALTGLDAMLRAGLWGEWGFAMIACSLAILLGGILLPQLSKHLRFTPPRLWQTPLWAAVPLVALPLAALTLPWGAVIFAGVLAVGLLALWRVSWNPHPWLQPIEWVAAVVAIAAVATFAWTRAPTDT